jgi:hypothetical protein
MSFSLVLRSIEAALGLVAMAACEAVPDVTQVPISADGENTRDHIKNKINNDVIIIMTNV